MGIEILELLSLDSILSYRKDGRAHYSTLSNLRDHELGIEFSGSYSASLGNLWEDFVYSKLYSDDSYLSKYVFLDGFGDYVDELYVLGLSLGELGLRFSESHLRDGRSKRWNHQVRMLVGLDLATTSYFDSTVLSQLESMYLNFVQSLISFPEIGLTDISLGKFLSGSLHLYHQVLLEWERDGILKSGLLDLLVHFSHNGTEYFLGLDIKSSATWSNFVSFFRKKYWVQGIHYLEGMRACFGDSISVYDNFYFVASETTGSYHSGVARLSPSSFHWRGNNYDSLLDRYTSFINSGLPIGVSALQEEL